MDGSFLTALSSMVSLPLLVLVTGGLGWAIIHHLRDCSDRRRDIYKKMEEMKKDIDERLDKLTVVVSRVEGYMMRKSEEP